MFNTISIHIYPVCYLKMNCLISTYFGNFQLFFCYRFFNFIVVWEQTLSNFYSFQFLRCNLWPRAWSIMVNVLFRDWTESVLCYCLMKSLVCVIIQLCLTLWSPGPCLPACQAPLSMEFSSKNIGVGRHSFLQGIFLTQGSNPDLPPCGQILYHLSNWGNPDEIIERCQLHPVNWWCWVHLCPYWFSACWICSFPMEEYWSLQL